MWPCPGSLRLPGGIRQGGNSQLRGAPFLFPTHLVSNPPTLTPAPLAPPPPPQIPPNTRVSQAAPSVLRAMCPCRSHLNLHHQPGSRPAQKASYRDQLYGNLCRIHQKPRFLGATPHPLSQSLRNLCICNKLPCEAHPQKSIGSIDYKEFTKSTLLLLDRKKRKRGYHVPRRKTLLDVWCLTLYLPSWASLEAPMVMNLPAVRETWVQPMGWEDPLEEGMATCSSILAWRIPWTEEPGGLQSIGLQRVGHN